MKSKWMKKVTAVMLAVTLAVPAGAMLGAKDARAAGTNLVSNGGFDSAE